MTHICVSKLTIIGSDNGLSPCRRQAIIWSNAGILLIRTLGTNFSEILIKIYTFSFRRMYLKKSSGKWRPFCFGLNVLRCQQYKTTMYWYMYLIALLHSIIRRSRSHFSYQDVDIRLLGTWWHKVLNWCNYLQFIRDSEAWNFLVWWLCVDIVNHGYIRKIIYNNLNICQVENSMRINSIPWLLMYCLQFVRSYGIDYEGQIVHYFHNELWKMHIYFILP